MVSGDRLNNMSNFYRFGGALLASLSRLQQRLRKPLRSLRVGSEQTGGGVVGGTGRCRLTDSERKLLERYSRFADNLPGVLFEFRMDGDGHTSFPYISERVIDLCGCSAEAAMADSDAIFGLMDPTDRERIFDEAQRSRQDLSVWDSVFRINTPHKGERSLHGRSTPATHKGEDGVVTWYGYIEDVTEFQRAQDRLKQAAEVFEATREGIVITDATHHVVELNRALSRLLGYSAQELAGKPIDQLFFPVQRETLVPAMKDEIDAAQGAWSRDVTFRTKSGAPVEVEAFVTRLRNEESGTVRHVALLHDISERIKYQAELERLASFDVLTGLPNRRLLTDRLDQAVAQAQRSGESFVVCMLDLDHFKPVNDSYGHEVGDEALQTISSRLVHTLRDEDTVARLGGDEFVIVIRDYRGGDSVFERILASLREPLKFAGISGAARVTGSLGAAVFDAGEPLDGDQLIRRADQASYRAKSSGGDRVVFFESMQAEPSGQ